MDGKDGFLYTHPNQPLRAGVGWAESTATHNLLNKPVGQQRDNNPHHYPLRATYTNL